MASPAIAKRVREPEPPDPVAIVRAYPNPVEIIRQYVESDFARGLATEHERKVAVIAHEDVTVADGRAFTRVGELLVDVANHRKDVEGWFKPVKDWAYRLHRAVCDRESEILRPLRTFETTAKENTDRFRRDEDRKRQEEEQRLAEIGRREEQERLTREAEFLEQRGESELAEQVLEQAVHAPAPVISIASTVPTVRGMSFRANWKWRPIGGDTPQARARAEKLVPREYMCLDEKKLNAYAKAHGAGARIPGIEFFDAGTVAVR